MQEKSVARVLFCSWLEQIGKIIEKSIGKIFMLKLEYGTGIDYRYTR
jgi:hypothetical protein